MTNDQAFKLRITLGILMPYALDSQTIYEFIDALDKITSLTKHANKRYINKIAYGLDVALSQFGIGDKLKAELLLDFGYLWRLPTRLQMKLHKRMHPIGSELHLPVLEKLTKL